MRHECISECAREAYPASAGRPDLRCSLLFTPFISHGLTWKCSWMQALPEIMINLYHSALSSALLRDMR